MISTVPKTLGLLLAAAVATASAAKAADTLKTEKQFGIAKPGQNNCISKITAESRQE